MEGVKCKERTTLELDKYKPLELKTNFVFGSESQSIEMNEFEI